MQVAAIVVVGERSAFADATEYDGSPKGDLDQPESFAGSPIVALELLGETALERSVAHLQAVGVQSISLVTKDSRFHVGLGSSTCRTTSKVIEPADSTWSMVASLVSEYAANGIDTILLIRLGAYLEFDFSQFLQFHRDNGQDVTRAATPEAPLDCWMIDARHFREAGVCFHEEKCMASKAGAQYYLGSTYVNRLLHAHDIRRLVIDALEKRIAIRPAGDEIKPGVWIQPSSHIHPRARIEGPVYIGRDVRIGATAFIASLSNVERNSRIDCGTSVADASILADTNLGAWLGVSQAVISGNRLANLRHNVTVEIQDDLLIKHTSSFARDRRQATVTPKPVERPELAPDGLKPQWSMFRAARALFVPKRAQ